MNRKPKTQHRNAVPEKSSCCTLVLSECKEWFVLAEILTVDLEIASFVTWPKVGNNSLAQGSHFTLPP